jgi:soluble lytic murein transglycosylase-like protein
MPMRIFRLLNKLSLPALALFAASGLRAGGGGQPPATGKPLPESVTLQKKAVASMGAALAEQRRSFRKQVANMPASQFFTLPSLPPLPAIAGSAIPTVEPSVSCPPMASVDLDYLIGSAARTEQLEPDLLRSVIQQESGARPCAVSSKGAMGLMQLMPATALEMGVHDAFDPKENVEGGARFLKQLLKMYGGDVSLALGAFNAGPGRVNQAGAVPDIPETVDYVQKILDMLPLSQ